MKQIVVLSGKGGTGKTSLTAAFSQLAENVVLADCDVDASNLPIIATPDLRKEEIFIGGESAVIDPEACINCGRCAAFCRFDAISFGRSSYEVTDYKCDGCRLCVRLCPTQAIVMKQHDKSRWFTSATRFGDMVHARLGVAEENSGKLVTKVRHQAKLLAQEQGHELVIIDGPPGIGCPATSSMSGVDLAVLVTEPTMSGLHDLKRILETASHFRIKPLVLINKFDLSLEQSQTIEHFCEQREIPVLGKIPFDKIFVQAMSQRKTVLECQHSTPELRSLLQEIWQRILEELT